MKTCFITGDTGFVGKNLKSFFFKSFIFFPYSKDDNLIIEQELVLHIAGKAHDFKKTKIPHEYYNVNTELTKKVFDAFLDSKAVVFITISSVKAIAESFKGI